MKPSYINFGSRAMVNLSDLGSGVFEVNRINTPQPFRGRGIARALMREVLTDADCTSTRLVLDINPYGDMDFSQLEAWYKRLGFKLEGDGRYWREPQVSV